MRLHSAAILTLKVILSMSTANATIFGCAKTKIDFTDLTDATNNATWSEPDKTTISNKGLSWNRDNKSPDREWIKTKPLPIGCAWRPPHGALVQVTIDSEPSKFNGRVYVRYSPDLRNWSSWQYLQPDDTKDAEKNDYSGTQFRLEIIIPRIEVEEYFALRREYKELDVPWVDDEEATVRWILQRNPDFFKQHIPFIGYIEFLVQGNQGIKTFRSTVSWGLSGIHQPPKDESLREARSGRWSFVGEEQ